MPPTIDPKKCVGCSECARNCPADAIKMVDDKATLLDPKACIECHLCAINCPVEAIVFNPHVFKLGLPIYTVLI
jgi:NAD-dependent dihydropyrimidine dehydrogenase PreA subunit